MEILPGKPSIYVARSEIMLHTTALNLRISKEYVKLLYASRIPVTVALEVI